MKDREILVPLLGEGTDVYINARCKSIEAEKHVITVLGETHGATAEFSVGDVVRLRKKSVSNQIKYIAVAVHGSTNHI